ncbi:hypothetical protein KKB55_21595 [Myxococcota bacterium]|nr:hypothetical protein [Myxococcota bacterium]
MRKITIYLFTLGIFMGCGELINLEGDACDEGADCIWPSVCCTAPRIPGFGDPLPLCESFRYCDAHLPFLGEGDPCERTNASFSACAEPLICCPQTRLCATVEGCAATPAPTPVAASGRACHADSDCDPGEVCEGIDMQVRDGQCAPLARLADASMLGQAAPVGSGR